MKKGLVLFFTLVLFILIITGCTKNKQNETDNTDKTDIIDTKDDAENDKNEIQEDEQQGENDGEISLEDETVSKLVDKIDFPEYVLASLYATGGFTMDTISNDMILRIGLANEIVKANNGLPHLGTTFNVIDKGPHIKFTSDEVNKVIKNIFGPDITYKNETFINANQGFRQYMAGVSEVQYSNDEYVTDFNEGGGGGVSQRIIQVPYDVTQVDEDNINIYVNIFYNTYFEEYFKDETGGADSCLKTSVYKNYDFSNETCSELVLSYSDTDKYEECKTDKILKFNSSEELNSYLMDNGIYNTYVYTFEKQSDGQYYLVSLKKGE